MLPQLMHPLFQMQFKSLLRVELTCDADWGKKNISFASILQIQQPSKGERESRVHQMFLACFHVEY